jgi:hypothetical protein
MPSKSLPMPTLLSARAGGVSSLVVARLGGDVVDLVGDGRDVDALWVLAREEGEEAGVSSS